MAIHFMCPQGHLLQGESSQMGQPSQCPMCGVVFLIPTTREAESPTPPPSSGQQKPKTGEEKQPEQELPVQELPVQELPVAEHKQTDQQKPDQDVQQQPATAKKRQQRPGVSKKNQPDTAEQQEVESEEQIEAFDPYHKWFGINVDIGEPKDQSPNFYRLLGINLFESDIDVISAAVKKRLLDIRNNQTGKDTALAQKIRNEVSAARVCLLDTNKKSQYDEQLRQAANYVRGSKLAPESSNEESTQPLESSTPSSQQTSDQKTPGFDTKQEPGSAEQQSAQAAKEQPADVSTGQQKKQKTPIEDSQQQIPAGKENQPAAKEQPIHSGAVGEQHAEKQPIPAAEQPQQQPAATVATQVPQPPPVPPEFGGPASTSTATGPPPVQGRKVVAGTTKATEKTIDTSTEPSKQPARAFPDLSGIADQVVPKTTKVSASSASPVLMPNPLVHVQCPEGHLLETPMEMMGERVMCPHCQRPFTLHHTDTVEYKRDRQAVQTRRTARFGRNALAWSIVAAVAVASGLIVLVIYIINYLSG